MSVNRRRAALDIPRARLHHQHISQPGFATPAEAVAWFGAVQAQDYSGALWAVGLRTRGATQSTIERALDEKAIVRTWPLRGTLHFVAAADARWMLALLGPRIIMATARRARFLGLDDIVVARARRAFVKALEGGRQLQRAAMYALLEGAKIPVGGGRGLYILWRAAHEGLICFGAREGRQQTFTLLEEWVPASRTLRRDDGLAELARRYFTSHGPATVRDFAWWSGLAAADARAALDLARDHFAHEIVHGQTYWFPASARLARDRSPSAYLLPSFDEYTVAYKDRDAVLDRAYAARMNSRNGILSPIVVIDGQVAGTWKRTMTRGTVQIEPTMFRTTTKPEAAAVDLAARRYADFLETPARVQR